MHRILLTAITLSLSLSASAQTLYGTGTTGSGGRTPHIWLESSAWPGNSTLKLTLEDAAPSAPTSLVLGLQRTSTPIIGIQLNLVPFVAMSLGLTDAAGAAQAPMPVPNDPTLAGLQLDFQWIIIDGGSSAGLSASRGLEEIVGEPPLVVSAGSVGRLDSVTGTDPRSGQVQNWSTGANNPVDIQFTPNGRLAVITATLSKSFIIVDASNNGKPLASVSVGASPNSCAITPDGKRAYGLLGGTQTSQTGEIIIFDVDPNSATFGQKLGSVAGIPRSTVQLEGVGISRDGKILTACNLGLGQASAAFIVDIDPTSPTYNQVRHNMPIGNMLTDIEPSTDGSLAFALSASFAGQANVFVIDCVLGTVVNVISGVGMFPTDLDVGPRGKAAWIGATNSNEIVRIAIDPLDPNFGAITRGSTPKPFSIALSPDSSRVYATEQGGTKVYELDSSSLLPLRDWTVGTANGAAIAVR